MREILFKGKRVDNGEWVEGAFLQSDDERRIATSYLRESDERDPIMTATYIIDPETVSQYTGLEDKNGTPIYENDILLSENEGKKIYVSVGFGKFTDVNSLDDDKQLGFYISFHGECSTIFNGESDGFAIYNMCTVVGNIFDNPELLMED